MFESSHSVKNPFGESSPGKNHLPTVAETSKRNLFKAFRSNKPLTEQTPVSTEPFDSHDSSGSLVSRTSSLSSQSSLSFDAKRSPVSLSKRTNKNLIQPSIIRSGSLDRLHKPSLSKPTVSSSAGSFVPSRSVSSRERTKPKPTSDHSNRVMTPRSPRNPASLASSSQQAPNTFKWVSGMSTPSTNTRMSRSTPARTFDPDHPSLPPFGCQRGDLRSILVLSTHLWKKELDDPARKTSHKQSLRARFSGNKVEWKNRVLVLTSWSEELADPFGPNKVQKVLQGYLHLFKTNAPTAKEIGRMELDADSEVGRLHGENPGEFDTDGRPNVLNVMPSKKSQNGTRRCWGDLEDTLTVQFETDALLQNWIHRINSIIFVKRADSIGLGEAARDYKSKHHPLTDDLNLALVNMFEESLKTPFPAGQETVSESLSTFPLSSTSQKPSATLADSPEVPRPLPPQIVSSHEFNEFGSREPYESTPAMGIITRPVLIGSSNPRVGHLAASVSASTAVPSSISRQPEVPCHLTYESETSDHGITIDESPENDPHEGYLRHSDYIWARELEIERLKRTEMELRAELELERLKNVERQLRAELMRERKRNKRGAVTNSESILDEAQPVEQYPISVDDSKDESPRVPSCRLAPGRKRASTLQSEASSYYFDSQGVRRPSDGTSYTSEDYVPSIVSRSHSVRRQTSKTSLGTCYSNPKEDFLYQIPSIRPTLPTALVHGDDHGISSISLGNVDASPTTSSSAKLLTEHQSSPIESNPIDRPSLNTKDRPRSFNTTASAGRRSDRSGVSPESPTSPVSTSSAGHAGGWRDMYHAKPLPSRHVSIPYSPLLPSPGPPPPPPPGPAPMCSLPPLPPLRRLSALKTD